MGPRLRGDGEIAAESNVDALARSSVIVSIVKQKPHAAMHGVFCIPLAGGLFLLARRRIDNQVRYFR